VAWVKLLIDVLGLIFLVILVVQWRRSGRPLTSYLGLDRTAAGPEFAVGFLIGTVAVLGVFVTEWLLGLIRVEGLQVPSRLEWLALIPLFALREELLYRGFMLTGLVGLLRSRVAAVLVTAVLFSLAHVGNEHATWLSIVSHGLGGVMYALAFLGTTRLWMPLGLHIAWNIIQGPVLGFPFSGGEAGGLVRQSATGPDLLTGGAYGLEAGLVGIGFRFVVMLLVIGWVVWRRSQRRPEQRADEPRAGVISAPNGREAPGKACEETTAVSRLRDLAGP
jgi:uncharacterized protein